MSRAARSVQVFGFYLAAVGLVLLVSPNALITPLGMPPAHEPWIRVLGLIVGLLGFYYHVAVRSEARELIRATVPARVTVCIVFGLLAVSAVAPAQLFLFGVIDLAGALWTAWAIRADRSDPVA